MQGTRRFIGTTNCRMAFATNAKEMRSVVQKSTGYDWLRFALRNPE